MFFKKPFLEFYITFKNVTFEDCLPFNDITKAHRELEYGVRRNISTSRILNSDMILENNFFMVYHSKLLLSGSKFGGVLFNYY